MEDKRVVFVMDEKPQCCFICPMGQEEGESGEPRRYCGVKGTRKECPPNDCPLVAIDSLRL